MEQISTRIKLKHAIEVGNAEAPNSSSFHPVDKSLPPRRDTAHLLPGNDQIPGGQTPPVVWVGEY